MKWLLISVILMAIPTIVAWSLYSRARRRGPSPVNGGSRFGQINGGDLFNV